MAKTIEGVREFLQGQATQLHRVVGTGDLPNNPVRWILGRFDRAVAKACADLAIIDATPYRTRGPLWFFGFDSVEAVPPGGRITMANCAQVRFQARKLLVPRSVGPDFLIQDFRVGTFTEVPAPTPKIPAEVFGCDLPTNVFEQIASRGGHGVDVEAECDGEVTAVLQYPNQGRHFDAHVTLPGMEYALTVENIGAEPKRFLAAVECVAS